MNFSGGEEGGVAAVRDSLWLLDSNPRAFSTCRILHLAAAAAVAVAAAKHAGRSSRCTARKMGSVHTLATDVKLALSSNV